MAGGKETPRQKMIGMMYLVLTALLALNVSKQIIAAFVTINNKLESSVQMIDGQVGGNYASFEKKKTTLKATGGSPEAIADLEKWQEKAYQVKDKTAETIGFLLGEANKMIKTSEGVDWVAKDGKDDKGNITKLKPLSDISGMDNYDIPTNMFIGGNPQKPKKEGLEIRNSVIKYRNQVAEIMATYDGPKGEKKYTFKAPESLDNLDEALKTANPDDTAAIRDFMQALDYPENITHKVHGHEETLPWPSVMFDHAPIVAAAAMITSLKLDVKNAEMMATQYLLGKVDVQEFDFNKIEPLPIAKTAYINQGDSLGLRVMIAAYDSTDMPKLKYGIDEDTANDENWKDITLDQGETIALPGDKPGAHKVKGVIMVKQRGVEVPKDWEFSYNVGQPMGVVAQPEMRVLYWGYENIVEGTASGYDPSKVRLSGSGVSLSSKGNGKYIAKVSRGTRNAKISVSATNDEGGSVNLGSFDFNCKPMPPALVKYGSVEAGGTQTYTEAKNVGRVSVFLDPSSPLQNVKYRVLGGTVIVAGVPGAGRINSGGRLNGKAMSMMKQSKGKNVAMEVKYKGPDGITRIGSLSFRVK